MDTDEQKTQNVVIMTGHQRDTGYSALSQVEAYWNALRGPRLLPARAEIDPRGIEAALEYTFILERIAPGMARLRIAGSHLSDLMGMEVRGMPLSSFVASEGRRELADTLEEVFQRPAVAELRLTSEGGFDKPAMDARLLLMPLKSDLGDVSRVLGCLVARGTIGRAPRRFDIAGIQVRPIATPAAAPQVTDEGAEAAPKPGGFSEDAAEMKPRRRAGDVPYLRLVEGNDD